MFDHLFESLRLKNLILPNRICFPAHRTNFAKKGCVSDRLCAYYGRRAEGGTGLIIIGELSIHPNDRPRQAMIETYDTGVVPQFRHLTQTIHKAGGIVFANLNHHGFQSSGAITRQACIAPSALSDIAFGHTAKAMETEDIETITIAFATAAKLAIEGGFDGIEIDMGHASLLRQFLSPLSNHRRDEYGGCLDNRMRLPLEVIHAIKSDVGQDVPVGIRLCADEMFWGAITLDESLQTAARFEASKQVDMIHVSVGTYYNLHLQKPSMHIPDGLALEAARKLKEVLHIPVIGAYQIDSPEKADKFIGEGQMDMAGMIRPLICDPDLPTKAKTGQAEDIRRCVKDDKGCIGRINQSKTLGCIQNPGVGYEGKAKTLPPAPEKIKTVWVVGAGPAGLEAARVAGARGHHVTVFEKKETPGGQLNLQTKGSGRMGLEEITRYLCHRLSQLKIPIKNNTMVTLEMVRRQKPDAVIIATGSVPVNRPVPGIYEPPFVQNVRDILEARYPVGSKILFVDEHGGHHATATAEFLAGQGKKVDMVTSELFIGIELASHGDLYLTRQRLLQKGVTFTTDVRVDKIENGIVFARSIYSNRPVEYRDYDTIVLDMGDKADDSLYFQLKGQVELYRIGDCVAPRGVDMAIFEGRKAGEAV